MYLSRLRFSPGAFRPDAAGETLPIPREPESAHKLAWRLFPDAAAHRTRAEFPFLFRVDERTWPQEEPQLTGGHGGANDSDRLETGYEVFMVSPVPPTAPDGVNCQARPYDPRPRPGQELRFSLRVNATITVAEIRSDGKKHKQHYDVVQRARAPSIWDANGQKRPSREHRPRGSVAEKVVVDWMMARAAQWGVEFPLHTPDEEFFDFLGVDEGGPRPDIQLLNYIPYLIRNGKRDTPNAPRMAVSDLEGTLIVRDPEKLRAYLLKGVGRGKAFGCGLLLVKPK